MSDEKHVPMPVVAKVAWVVAGAVNLVIAGTFLDQAFPSKRNQSLQATAVMAMLALALGLLILASLVYFTEVDNKKGGKDE
jgi:hypothetical protein